MMNRNIYGRYFEDVADGEMLDPMTKVISLAKMTGYGVATSDFVRIHYDRDYARDMGFGEPVVDGQMFGAFLVQMVQNWAGPWGRLLKLSFQNRIMVYAGESVICCGKVIKRYRSGGQNLIEFSLWITNQSGQTVVRG